MEKLEIIDLFGLLKGIKYESCKISGVWFRWVAVEIIDTPASEKNIYL